MAIVAAAATALHSDVPVAAPIGIAATTPAVLVDVVERRLPNRMLVLAAALMSIATAATATFGVSTSWTNALIGAALMAAPLTIVHVIAPHAMGFGDVKLALVLGFALGLVHPTWSLVALLVASAGSAAFGLIARRSTIAFGPGLALGATAALLLTSLGFGDFIHNDEPTSTVLAQEAT